MIRARTKNCIASGLVTKNKMQMRHLANVWYYCMVTVFDRRGSRSFKTYYSSIDGETYVCIQSVINQTMTFQTTVKEERMHSIIKNKPSNPHGHDIPPINRQQITSDFGEKKLRDYN